MPHSSHEGKERSAEWVAGLAPRRILDIGPGVGTYLELLRPLLPGSRWTAVEIHRPYVDRYELADRYDDLVIGDVRQLDWRGHGRWDLVIFGDVLEHLDLPDARRAWQWARMQGAHVLASVPIVHYPQGAHGGNVHECHRVTYDHELITRTFPGIVAHETGRQIGVYLATGSPGALG